MEEVIIPSTKRVTEPAWHRRSRRQRTRSRGILRTFLSTGIGVPSQITQAIFRLGTHHSASTLPAAARDRLLSLGAMSEGDNWCSWCAQYVRRGAKFCQRCGKEVGAKPSKALSYAAAETYAPWRSQDWHTESWKSHRPPSRQRRRQSPRGGRDQGDKGRGKGKADGKSKDAGKRRDPGTAAPSTDALPQPPAPPTLVAPAAASAGPETQSAAQCKLDALVAALRTAGSLPSEVVALLGQQDEAATKDQAKAMHGAVNQRTQAEKELNRVRSSRKAYLCSWASYLQQMCTTVEQQFAQQQKTLDAFNSMETKWSEKLAESTAALARLTGNAAKAETDTDIELDPPPSSRTGTFEEGQDPWNCAELIAQQQTTQQLQLVHALRKAKEAADQTAEAAPRGASRTPRRKARDEDAETTTAAADPGKAPT